MYYALNDKGALIRASEASKEDVYYCPCCKDSLILRKGDIVRHHFAHKSSADCDTFTHDMSDWHRDWQSQFPEVTREVHIKAKLSKSDLAFLKGDIGFRDYGEEKVKYVTHRADVCYVRKLNNLVSYDGKVIEAVFDRNSDVDNGIILEFQHSPISKAEFEERNEFYNACGFRVIWIFDVTALVDDGILYDVKRDKKSKSDMWVWKKPWRIFENFDPSYSCNSVFFQTIDADLEKDSWYLKKVTWCIYDEEKVVSSFRRFYAKYLPGSVEFLKKEYQLDNRFMFKYI